MDDRQENMRNNSKKLQRLTELEFAEAAELEKDGKFAKGLIAGIIGTLCVSLALAAALLFWNARHAGTGGGSVPANLVDSAVKSKVNELAAIIEEYYYEDVDVQGMADGLYKGLFDSLGDPYSAYYTKEEYEEMMISASAQYYGIGAVLQQDPHTKQVQIVRIYDNTPAHEAGLKAGDLVIKVGDIESRSMELTELVTHIRGEENSTVHLIISRTGEEKYLEYDVRRRKVDVPTVDGQMLGDGIGYIIVAEFGEATAKDFESKVEQLQSEGMQKLIIDLRDNPGGMMDTVIEMLDYILPDGLIVYTEDKYGNRQEYTSDAERYLDLPMAVLINGNSASCSEIFAGAIRDYGYGTLIGTLTFGKGIVQNVRPLTDGSAIKLTTAKYYTPKGENIHGTGIKPDIELKYKYTGKKNQDYDYMKDNQVKRAVKELAALE